MLAGKQKFFIVILKLSCFFISINVQAQFAPAPPDINSTAVHKDDISISFWANEVILNRSWQNIADTTLGKASVGNENSAIGKANNLFVSLGDGGSAILKFPFPIFNEEGYDFAVYENGFAQENDEDNFIFMELALVEVSQNGVDFIPFFSSSNTDTSIQVGSFSPLNCTKINNLAGKYALNYGTPFDLEELGLDSIVSIKIIDVVGSIDSKYASYDSQGRKINDPFPTPFPSSGFDLNAVAALNQKNKIENTNIISPSNTNSLNIYPNPVHIGSKLHLENNSQEETQMFIYNSNGEKVLSTHFNNTFQLSTNNMSTGMYFIQIYQQNSFIYYKFIVE